MSKDAIMSVVVCVWDSFDNQPSEHISLSLGVLRLILLPSPKQPFFSSSQNIPASVLPTTRDGPCLSSHIPYSIQYRTLLNWILCLICLMWKGTIEIVWTIMENLSLPQRLATWLTTGVWRTLHFHHSTEAPRVMLIEQSKATNTHSILTNNRAK